MQESIEQYGVVFRKAYEFMKKHLNAETTEDWMQLIDGQEQFKTQFEMDLATAIATEIGRVYEKKLKNEKKIPNNASVDDNREVGTKVPHGEEQQIKVLQENENKENNAKKEILELFRKGISEVLESENFKNWLTTSSKMVLNGYSFKNGMLIFMQKPNATYAMGYEAWKRFGRQVKKGAKGIKIWTPVMAREKVKGGLYGMIKKELKEQLRKNPELEQAIYRFGTSSLEFSMMKNGIIGLRNNGKEIKLFAGDDEAKKYIERNIIGKVPIYFNLTTVFDKSDVIIPEYLWVKNSSLGIQSRDELSLDENGQIQKNRRGEVKIINTPDRQARFVESLDLTIVGQDPTKMGILFSTLQNISEKKGVKIHLVDKEQDLIIKGGAKGYYHRPDKEHPEGYIKIDDSLEPTELVSVALHEITHSNLHRNLESLSERMGETVTRETREIHAEAVAYMVAKNFGVETDLSSFQYLAAFSKGRELQDLQKSLHLIFEEGKKLTGEIEKELDKMGLTLMLDKKPSEPIMDEQVRKYQKSYIDAALSIYKENAEAKREVAAILKESKNKDERTVLLAMGDNVNMQNRECENILKLGKQLGDCPVRAEQDTVIDKLLAANSCIVNLQSEFEKLTDQLINVTRGETYNVRTRFSKDVAEVLENMKREYKELGKLSSDDIKYITTSKFISQTYGALLRSNPHEFVDQVMKRIEEIEKTRARNGSFIEVNYCEEWEKKPIFKKGDIMHPKEMNNILKRAELRTMSAREQAAQVGENYPNTECDMTVYTQTATNGLCALNTRVNIGDGKQIDMLSHMSNICNRGYHLKDKQQIFENLKAAVKERGIRNGKNISYDQKETKKIESVVDR